MVGASSTPEAMGYIFFDPKKCTGCKSCMLACTTVNDGAANLSLARIQILDEPFGQFPTDVEINLCRQCRHPLCLEACPVDAIYADGENMNVRRVDLERCNGCRLCIKACPFTPSMMIWDAARHKALKCDLCLGAPHGDRKGTPACVEVCPPRALAFSPKPPRMLGPEGYVVNLRGEGWRKLELPVEGRGRR